MVIHKPLILGRTLRNSTHIWLVSKMRISYAVYISLQFLGISYTTMGGGRNLCNSELMSLWTRIMMKIRIKKMFTVNSDVDVVTLESDCLPSSRNSSYDGTMSGPKHMEIVSPNTPPKVFRSASKRFTNLSFATRCYHTINYLRSPESDRVYPFFTTHKLDRQNFKKRTESFRWDEHRQKLFHFYKDQFGLGRYKIFSINLKKLANSWSYTHVYNQVILHSV